MPFKKQTTRSTSLTTDTKSIFIARTNELLFFIHHILEPEEPTYNIISISGQGGIGKSTLINHFIEEAHATNFKDYCITAKIDERQTTPASIMDHFANQFRAAGQPLKKFEEALADYKESLRRTQGGHEVEQEILIRDAADIVGTVAEDIPFVGGLVGQPAIGLQRGGKGERMKEEKGSTQEQTSDGKTSQREFASVQPAGRTGTAAGREGQQRTGR